jgi:hypothetical protein
LNAVAILASTFVVKSNYPGFFKENLYEMYFSHNVFKMQKCKTPPQKNNIFFNLSEFEALYMGIPFEF